GAMHIAAVVKTPQVAVFGPGYLTRFDPRIVSQKAVVLHAETACAPCNRVSCGSRACLNAIPVKTVLDAALKLLGKK
ncbi:MAG TPA: glycosyltransferase family 9 protein, partial [Candidatus Omnitrophota bacterium]|nr:glycosyltransferase family 9 protein [Candidatus Omnitrophota bacterium]